MRGLNNHYKNKFYLSKFSFITFSNNYPKRRESISKIVYDINSIGKLVLAHTRFGAKQECMNAQPLYRQSMTVWGYQASR